MSFLFLSEAAKDYADLGFLEEARCLFEYIRRKDTTFIHNLEFYSTVLWHNKDFLKLGALCKSLIAEYPTNYRTWLILGNYFSVKKDVNRAILCLKRSVIAGNSWYAQTLLGHELLSKQDYTAALGAFTKSYKSFINNYNATFGIGNVYMYLDKKDNSNFYLMKSLKINEKNMFLRFLVVKIFIHNNELDKAFSIICGNMEVKEENYGFIVDNIIHQKIKKDQEPLILELVSILIKKNYLPEAKKLLDNIRTKNDAYHIKNKQYEMAVIAPKYFN
ncbi:hypothetical protein EDEG_03525 [Edhazardia aedis USNM 41457]|uniref:Uncharacterized protein n=1 Tax=Edhazardia aedis (strain USNM 41457) TaxID=1003232 RepID=J8ZQN7_EDHAE|nr:hypothetical protein EDEG_03525 [Edhazardia aedis USNM 41457]|eukprot:EJW02028.1 hypothetical protein EDEG_03525 [Edhazardia aedis USNM 41457]